jgi:hypothetical protein
MISDGSSNIVKESVENVSFLVRGISYYWKRTSIGATKAGPEWTLANLKVQALEIIMGTSRSGLHSLLIRITLNADLGR